MTREEIVMRLWELGDERYREFQLGLMPGVECEAVIGVRLPALRALAKELVRQCGVAAVLDATGHEY